MRKLSAAAAVLAMLLSGCEASSAIESADNVSTDILTEAAYASITEDYSHRNRDRNNARRNRNGIGNGNHSSFRRI